MSQYQLLAELPGPSEATARPTSAETLIIVAKQDHLLLPATTDAFARRIGAELMKLATDCGHYAFACEQERISTAVRTFLD